MVSLCKDGVPRVQEIKHGFKKKEDLKIHGLKIMILVKHSHAFEQEDDGCEIGVIFPLLLLKNLFQSWA